jgi:hypothetical protein
MSAVSVQDWLPRQYFTLVASLPVLPRFDKAQRLPISKERLDQRLAMLSEQDAAILRQAEQFLAWRYHPLGRTDADIIARHAHLINQVRQPTLHNVVLYRMNVRTLVAAMRHRLRDHRPVQEQTPWGVGPLVKHIEQHWDAADFNLSRRFPWVGEADMLMQSGDSLGLQYLLLNKLWEYLQVLGQGHYFDFDLVLIYLFKWDILSRWLSYDETQALQRFDELKARGYAAYGRPLFSD